MKIISSIKKYLPPINEKLIIGVSGGVDSMVLLDILNNLGYKLVVGHVNYNLRKNSPKDYELIKKYCSEKRLQLEYLEIKDKPKGNTQGETRKIRYKFFKKISNQTNIPHILIAHHQDDHIETYLLQKKRNIIIEHYGLKHSRESFGLNIIRPMLDVSKKQILDYAKYNNITWNEDVTNKENKYQRNKIRNLILQELSWLKKKIILLDIKVDNKKSRILFKSVKKIEEQYVINNKMSFEIFELPKAQVRIIIYSYLKDNRYPISRINKKIIEEIIAFSNKTKKIVAVLDLAKDFKLKKENNWYYIIKEK